MPSFDVPAAFLHIPLDKKSNPRKIVMYLQKDLPHPLAGQWVEVIGALYGLKQCNNLFEADLRKQFTKAGFISCPSDPCVYVKFHPADVRMKCIVCMHVDDGQAIHNCPQVYKQLMDVLEEKYGPLEHHPQADSFLGHSIARHKRGSITFGMEGYIRKLALREGIDPSERVQVPSNLDLFHPPYNVTPYDLKLYQKLIGGLIYVLKIRHDVHKEVIYLATKTKSPTVSDYNKARQVLVFLQSTIKDGPTFYTEEGPILYGSADASYGVHEDSRSQSGYYVSIGRNSAPIYCHTGKQMDCVSQSAMEAEYVCVGELGKKVLWCRYLLSDVGFAQNGPTTFLQDNNSCISLAKAPQIPRRSRHIHIRHHAIRNMCVEEQVKFEHVPTHLLTSDLLTKPLTADKFIPFKFALLNMRYYTAYKAKTI